LTEDAEEAGRTITDVSESERQALADRDLSDHPLCNWKEIQSMHESGLVDFQSHGMYHELISISPKIVDFIHPDFDAYHYGNIRIPIFVDATSERSRAKVLGHPVYDSAPRLSGRPRYFDPPALRRVCEEFVTKSGGARFFSQPDWRTQLCDLVDRQPPESRAEAGSYESLAAVDEAIQLELADSKQAIETRLAGKAVRHFCFPWFEAPSGGADLACESGYSSIHLGAFPRFLRRVEREAPVIVSRLQEEYLFRLPGKESISMVRVLSLKNAIRATGAHRE
jgi:hypothetical protein